MSVTSSFLRHQGLPGLQAQKWVATENVSASPRVTGTTLAMVWPNISTTCPDSDISASSDQTARDATRLHLGVLLGAVDQPDLPESRPARQRANACAEFGLGTCARRDDQLALRICSTAFSSV